MLATGGIVALAGLTSRSAGRTPKASANFLGDGEWKRPGVLLAATETAESVGPEQFYIRIATSGMAGVRAQKASSREVGAEAISLLIERAFRELGLEAIPVDERFGNSLGYGNATAVFFQRFVANVSGLIGLVLVYGVGAQPVVHLVSGFPSPAVADVVPMVAAFLTYFLLQAKPRYPRRTHKFASTDLRIEIRWSAAIEAGLVESSPT